MWTLVGVLVVGAARSEATYRVVGLKLKTIGELEATAAGAGIDGAW